MAQLYDTLNETYDENSQWKLRFISVWVSFKPCITFFF